jgi:hypothetical protein
MPRALVRKEFRVQKERDIEMFYEYNQNNSGGSFDVDKEVCHRVYIEADNKDDACFIAQSKGIYFDGVSSGRDCGCCGDRWYPQDEPVDLNHGSYAENEARALADKYGAKCVKATRKYASYTHDVIYPNIEAYAQYLADEHGWTAPDARIFYKDGTVKEIFKEKK